MAISDKVKALSYMDTLVFGRGEVGVDGAKMIATVANETGYGVIVMVSGPNLLDLQLTAKCLALLYLTEAQVKISSDDPAGVQTMLQGGKKMDVLQDFHCNHQFVQENVVAEDGSVIAQSFFRYDRNEF